MCGIGGLLSPGGLGPYHEEILDSMTLSLSHRGPDGKGVWMDDSAAIGLCHTRLAVIDLSDRASQPMADPQGRAVLTYNGEIYNYRELRSQLRSSGWQFTSDSDTEVVLKACLQWGVGPALERFVGMFAFAFWHVGERALYLVRDRMGIKPLYYGRASGGRVSGGRSGDGSARGDRPDDDLIFASELKALCVHPGFDRVLDINSLEHYLMLQYVPSPGSIYRDAKKLPAGHFLRVSPEGETMTKYWEPGMAAYSGPGDPHEVDGELASMIQEAISSRLVSDVPVGTFLSGGLDSCLVTSGIQGTSSEPLSSYTVSYAEEEFDEGPWAAQAATQLGVPHRVLKVTSSDLLETIDDLPWIYDEPLSDPSALPLVLLSRFAREEVTVILSGDGGDETFGGYDRYSFLERYWVTAGKLPLLFRQGLSSLMRSVPPGLAGTAYSALFHATGRSRPVENFPGKWEKLLRVIQQGSYGEAYQASIGIFSTKETARLLGREGKVELPGAFESFGKEMASSSERIRAMMELDQRTFLPEDVLAKVDRASMASGLEVRVPLLDHRIVSLSRQYGTSALFENRKGKAPLRRLAMKSLAPDLVNRPKMGFTLPLDSWFRTELRETVRERLLSPGNSLEGLVNEKEVKNLVDDHLAGRANYHEKLYNLMVLNGWMERWTRAA